MYNAVEDAKAQVKEMIMGALGRLVAEGKIPSEPLPPFQVTIPADNSHGDFSANTALVSAKALKNNPRAIAQMIADAVEFAGTDFSKVEVAGPGFLNFFIGESWFGGVVRNAVAMGEDYGKTDLGKGKRVLVEFVSANPTGPMHIGNARGGALGDSLSSLLQEAGYEVSREFYINDAGNQVAKFGKSLDLRYMQLCSDAGQSVIAECGDDMEKLTKTIYDNTSTPDENGDIPEEQKALPFTMPNDVYLGMDIIEHAKNYYDLHGGKALSEKSDEERRKALVDYALPLNERRLEEDLLKYRIKYDNWFKESTLHNNGAVADVIEKLKAGGHTYEKDGALWLRATDFGGDQDFVLVRSNGFPTYIVPDIAYHYDKLITRNYDKAINVLGADHHGYVQRMRIALSALGIDEKRLDVVIMQMVMLIRDGKPCKLSKRSGKAITLTTLLDEVPIDAARFVFNQRTADTHLEFDLDLAVEESSKNPVFYVQYAHARICSIIRRQADEGVQYRGGEVSYSDPAEYALIRKIAEMPEMINQAAKDYDPSALTRYSYELAQTFHKFYDSCPIKGAEDSVKLSRLALCTAAKTALKNVLSLLKVEAPERM
ncbi:MAG: arginine--tRNA ligase [Oscillospiraceae bacterium]|nr:arginine--tRNA ligase [Oscillospiraceae bacterium]